MKSQAARLKEQALAKLAAVQQTHLLEFWDELCSEKQHMLYRQIEELDLDLFDSQKKALKERRQNLALYESFSRYDESGSKENEEIGFELASHGKVACLVLAGGQGSRLRFSGPKGCYPVSLVRNKCLYQLIGEKVRAASELVGRDLLVAFMTSPLNQRETELFFMQHSYFGLKASQVAFFTQKMWPFLDFEQNLFLESPYQIAAGPNGNGEVFSRIEELGLLKKWEEQNVEFVNILPIDNPLAIPFDFELFGFQKRKRLDVALKAAWRKNPQEKVGILVLKNKKPSILEYSEIEEGKFTDQAIANLGLYSVSTSFIKRAASVKIPYHVAKKAVKRWTKEGKVEFPKEPNAWKFEKFIFDTFEAARSFEALLYPKESVFAPLKNLEGEDSIETVQNALMALERKLYLDVTGVSVPTDAVFELASEFYYPSEGLRSKWKGKQLPNVAYIEA